LAGSAPVDSIGALRGNPQGRGKFDERLHFHTRRGPKGLAGPPRGGSCPIRPSPQGARPSRSRRSLRGGARAPGGGPGSRGERHRARGGRPGGRDFSADAASRPGERLHHAPSPSRGAVAPGPVDLPPQSAGLPQTLDPAIAATRRLSGPARRRRGGARALAANGLAGAPQRDRRGRVDGAFAVPHSSVRRLGAGRVALFAASARCSASCAGARGRASCPPRGRESSRGWRRPRAEAGPRCSSAYLGGATRLAPALRGARGVLDRRSRRPSPPQRRASSPPRRSCRAAPRASPPRRRAASRACAHSAARRAGSRVRSPRGPRAPPTRRRLSRRARRNARAVRHDAFAQRSRAHLPRRCRARHLPPRVARARGAAAERVGASGPERAPRPRARRRRVGLRHAGRRTLGTEARRCRLGMDPPQSSERRGVPGGRACRAGRDDGGLARLARGRGARCGHASASGRVREAADVRPPCRAGAGDERRRGGALLRPEPRAVLPLDHCARSCPSVTSGS
jgi:hypothetical protein